MNTTKSSATTSRLILSLGTLASIVIIGGVLYKVQQESFMEAEVLTIPEQSLETPTEVIKVPEAMIPENNSVEESKEPKKPKIKQPSLPNLDASDQFIRDRLVLLSEKRDLVVWLTTDDILRRSASYLDGLARGVILSNIFPLSSPEGEFSTHRDEQTIWLNAGNYERYDNTVSVISSLDMDLAAQIFHLTRPLLEGAFSELGYRPRQMDGIILTALDQIMNTPVIFEPIQLSRDSVNFKFFDSKLESLTPLQKQLVRAGPENTRRLQKQAKLLRTALMTPSGRQQ
ncbi:MAG: DUF3014 domain-containing protein [Porticoccaceae bacterium]|nr:MAG: hypothetical protein CND57_00820 [SAR92 bacterium MED-G29]